MNKSGRLDSNQRPLEPHSSALPGCATPRKLRMLPNYFIIIGLKSQVKIDCSGYLVLRIFKNRDLLKVNPQDGRCGFLTNAEYHTRILADPTRKLSMKGLSTNSVRLGNRQINGMNAI